MKEEAFNQLQKEGKVKVLEKPQPEPIGSLGLQPFSTDEYQPLLEALRRVKRHRTSSSSPDFWPKNFLDSIQPFDNGSVRGFRMYINGNWWKFTGSIT
jgi:hypothetical protein